MCWGGGGLGGIVFDLFFFIKQAMVCVVFDFFGGGGVFDFLGLR